MLPQLLTSEDYKLLTELGLTGPASKKAAQAFQEAFDMIGGVYRLAKWADKNPDKFYALYSKLVPATVEVDEKKELRILIEWASSERLSYRYKHAEVSAPATVPALPQPETALGVSVHPSAGGQDSGPGE